MKTSLYLFSFLMFSINVCFASELPTVSRLLLETPFNTKHVKKVLAGEIVTTDIVPVSKTELAQGVACLVKNTAKTNLDAIHKETWLAPEQHVLSSLLIPEHASLADFKGIHFNVQNKNELERFFEVKAGQELNLSLSEISAFEKLKAEQNNQLHVQSTELLIHHMLLSRFQRYRKQGLKGISPYARGSSEITHPGNQLNTSLEESFGLKEIYPQLYYLLKDYPQTTNATVDEDYYWYLVSLGDRPAVGLSHRIHSKIGAATLLIERGYYISHTLDSVQILVGLIPVQEGTLLLYVNRTWTEEISGLFARVKRKIANKIMRSQMDHVLKNIQICRNLD